jgi:hypothetical protein
MTPIKDISSYNQMVIVEKYEKVIAYLYPIAQSVPRKHGVVRDMFLQCLLGIPDLFFQAGKSNQVSKIYVADAGLAQLRFWVRFLVSIKCMTSNQNQTFQTMIGEVGGILNVWIKHKKAQGQTG